MCLFSKCAFLVHSPVCKLCLSSYVLINSHFNSLFLQFVILGTRLRTHTPHAQSFHNHVFTSAQSHANAHLSISCPYISFTHSQHTIFRTCPDCPNRANLISTHSPPFLNMSHTHTHTYIHTTIHMHTRIYIYIHKHTHTHTHKHFHYLCFSTNSKLTSSKAKFKLNLISLSISS